MPGNYGNKKLLNGEHSIMEMLREYLHLPESALEVRANSIDLVLRRGSSDLGRVSCFSVCDSSSVIGVKAIDLKSEPKEAEKNEALLMADGESTAEKVKAFLEKSKDKHAIPYEIFGQRIFKVNLDDFLRVEETQVPTIDDLMRSKAAERHLLDSQQ